MTSFPSGLAGCWLKNMPVPNELSGALVAGLSHRGQIQKQSFWNEQFHLFQIYKGMLPSLPMGMVGDGHAWGFLEDGIKHADWAQLKTGFSAAVLHHTAQKISLVRDRIGTKALFFTFLEEGFAFASSVAPLLECRKTTTRVNHQVLFHHLVTEQSSHQEFTLFKDIYTVPAGCVVEIDLHKASYSIQKWHHPIHMGDRPTVHSLTYNDSVQAIKSQVTKTISTWANQFPEEKMGALLSGGIDSSVINGVLRQLGYRIPALTATFGDHVLSEESWAKRVVDRHDLSWIKIQPKTTDFVAQLDALLYTQGEPMHSPGTFLQHQLFKRAAQEGRTFIWDGQGADALLGGHSYYSPRRWLNLWQNGEWKTLREETHDFGGLTASAKYTLRNVAKYRWTRQFPFRPLIRSIKKATSTPLSFLQRDWLAQFDEHWPQGDAFDSLHGMLTRDFYGNGGNQLLRFLERAAHHYGVSPLSPFAEDPVLQDIVLRTPGDYFLNKGVHKSLLKDAFADILPPEVLHRSDKMGLVAPTNEWICAVAPQVKPYFEALPKEIFNHRQLMGAYDDFFQPKSPVENYQIFKFISFAVWWHVYNVKI